MIHCFGVHSKKNILRYSTFRSLANLLWVNSKLVTKITGGEVRERKNIIIIIYFFGSSHFLLLHGRIRASWQGFPRRPNNCWLTLRTRLQPPGGERRLLTELLAITNNIHSSPPWGCYCTAEQFSNRLQCTIGHFVGWFSLVLLTIITHVKLRILTTLKQME